MMKGRTILSMVISNVVSSRTSEIGDCKHVASKRGDIGDNGGMTCGAVTPQNPRVR